MRTRNAYAVALWACHLAMVAVVDAATCPHDRALFPTESPSLYSSLSSFCNTYTKTINTATTGLPARVTSGCYADRLLISSACSCNPGNPTPTTTTTTASCAPSPVNNVVQNGGFECGLAPWVFAGEPNYSYRFYGVGDHSLHAIILQDKTGISKYATLSQNVTVITGQRYTLKYRTTTDGCNPGDVVTVRALLNGAAVDSVNECSLPRESYVSRAATFTATKNPTTLTFEFFASDFSDAYLDNVVIVRS
ncbi:hypothetical protein G7Y79_00046g082450 [Physcia stellaris]|nr:hypothetical protein G7Y79_00046g082450 [Physcia stellaris]